VKERGGKLALVINENFEGLFRVSRTRNLFTIAPDVPSAVRAVS
jgi:hypothetical protein